jgi:hypothetical protein
MHVLARAYQRADRLDRCIALSEEAYERSTARLGPDHPDTSWCRLYLGYAYLTAGMFTKSQPLLRESLSIGEKDDPDDWFTFLIRNRLGGSLLGQKKYAEAEPLILQGYQGLKSREAKIPGRSKKSLAEAAGRVVKLYEAWGKPDQAAAWKAKLGMPDLPADVFARP